MPSAFSFIVIFGAIGAIVFTILSLVDYFRSDIHILDVGESDSNQLISSEMSLEQHLEIIFHNKVYVLELEDLSDYQKINRAMVRIKDYFSALESLISASESNLIVVDFVIHGKMINLPKNVEDLLIERHVHYFKHIEQIIKRNKNINYTRILQLPAEFYGLNHVSDSGYTKGRVVSYLVEALRPLSKVYIEHIIRMVGMENFTLKVMPRPIRTSSFLLIDQRFLVNELDRFYFSNGQAVADRLWFNHSGESKKVEEMINLEWEMIYNCTDSNNAYICGLSELNEAREMLSKLNEEIAEKNIQENRKLHELNKIL